MDPAVHHPNNWLGMWFFQARCSCGWRGPRRWFIKQRILIDYEVHHEDWYQDTQPPRGSE